MATATTTPRVARKTPVGARRRSPLKRSTALRASGEAGAVPALSTADEALQPVATVTPQAANRAATQETLIEQLWRYQVDWAQRAVLYLDVLRQRADNMLVHESAGSPPLLNFEYEVVLDAGSFDAPVNYALLRIVSHEGLPVAPDAHKRRPVLIVDPRAGHGPGIGGFKRDSEVGMALREGRAVYFVSFFPEPRSTQTLADVHHALRRFVAEVCRLHGGTAPVLYGNCQGGWAVALLAADCQGTAGPVVMNGSPLSYWAGESDVNPMRLAGAFLGGAWLAHFTADLGNGLFDGAWLVHNFEMLNPAHSYFAKDYQVFAHVESERERFLEFERWWSGYYFLSREEIKSIVENLFIGDKLEQGQMRICESCVADLRRISHPVVIFASSADNITPPHQALNWIPAVYPSTQALKDAGQRIVYLINEHVGHLGIFVSADVARHEHRTILSQLERIESLEPGLYQMVIEPSAQGDEGAPRVRYEERQVEDVRYAYPREAFEKVRRISEANEAFYASWVSPWVKAWANPWGAAWQKWAHPMRLRRYLWATALNPVSAAVAQVAPAVQAAREPLPLPNAYIGMEAEWARQATGALDQWRHMRDQWGEALFSAYFQ